MRIKQAVKHLARRLQHVLVIDRRKLYAFWEADHLRRLLSLYAVDCVFDVGANNGQYARMLRSEAKFKGLIISFEPNPDAAAEARRLTKGTILNCWRSTAS